jgi:hypothetical protein
MFFIGEAALLNSKGNYEWFPFYSWSMFALVPQEEVTYRLTTHPISAEAVQTARKTRNLQEFHLIQKLGRAIEEEDLLSIAELRQTLEGNHLHGNLVYEISRLKQDPLELWNSQLATSEAATHSESEAGSEPEIIARFSTQAQQPANPLSP